MHRRTVEQAPEMRVNRHAQLLLAPTYVERNDGRSTSGWTWASVWTRCSDAMRTWEQGNLIIAALIAVFYTNTLVSISVRTLGHRV